MQTYKVFTKVSYFLFQVVQLRTFVKYEKPVTEEPSNIEHSPSPTLSDSSRSSAIKSENKRRTKIQSSFRVARNNIRRKISNRTMSPCPQVVLKSENSGSKPSLTKNNSDNDFGFGSEAYEKREKEQ